MAAVVTKVAAVAVGLRLWAVVTAITRVSVGSRSSSSSSGGGGGSSSIKGKKRTKKKKNHEYTNQSQHSKYKP